MNTTVVKGYKYKAKGKLEQQFSVKSVTKNVYIIILLLSLLFIGVNKSFANKTFIGGRVGSQSGIIVYGTASSTITFLVSFNTTGSGSSGSSRLSINFTASPSGVSGTFNPSLISANNSRPSPTSILTITTGNTSPAGVYAFTVSESNNHTTATGTLTITPKAITITANNQSKIYGTAFTFAGTEFTSTGLVNGNTVTSTSLSSAGNVYTASVGTYNIVASAAAGTGLGNYTISYTNGTMTVNTKALTITANNQSKCIGNSFTFVGTEFSNTALIPGDALSTVTLISSGTSPSALASTYPIVPSSAVGSRLSNYNITYVNGTFTVNPLPMVTASVSPASLVCIGTNVTLTGNGALTYTWTGGITNATPFSATGTTTFTITGTDLKGCQNTASQTIIVNQLPTIAEAGNNQTICLSGTSLSANSANSGIGVWSISSGPSTDLSQFNGINNPSAPFIPNGGAGVYNLVWTINNSPCSPSSSSVVITVQTLGYWLGINSNWQDVINWCGGVPTYSSNVVIPSVVINNPLINAVGAVCNNITISNGATLSMIGPGELTLKGNWINNGNFNFGDGTVRFGGSTLQRITGATTFYYLYINNPLGVTLNNNITVKSYLELNTGSLSTVTNLVKLDTNAYIGTIGGYVNGNLQQYVLSGFYKSLYYPIGKVNNNTPLNLTFNNVYAGGYITAYTTNGDHAQIGSSGFNTNQTINRTWSLSNSGVTYDSYSVGLTYLNSDEDSGFSSAYASTKLYSNGTWTNLPNGSSSQNYQTASNITLLGDFQIGTINPVPSLYSLTPAQGNTSSTFNVVFKGAGFIAGFTTISVGAGITVNSTDVTSDTTLISNITIAASATLGTRSFTASNGTPGGGISRNVGFLVMSLAPTLTRLSPAKGAEGQNLNVTFHGTGFVSGLTTVTSGTGITVNSLNVISSTVLTAHLIISLTAAIGNHPLSVFNGGRTGGGASGNINFMVTTPLPIANFTASSLSIVGYPVGRTTFTSTSSYIDSYSTYRWDFGSGAIPSTSTLAGPIVVSYSSKGAKTISLTVTNVNGSNTVIRTNYIMVNAPIPSSPTSIIENLDSLLNNKNDEGLILTGLNVPTVNDEFTLYPNPFISNTTLTFSESQMNTTVKIIDVVGKEIKSETFSGKEYILEKGTMKAGIYFVRITDVNKNVMNRKIVVE